MKVACLTGVGIFLAAASVTAEIEAIPYSFLPDVQVVYGDFDGPIVNGDKPMLVVGRPHGGSREPYSDHGEVFLFRDNEPLRSIYTPDGYDQNWLPAGGVPPSFPHVNRYYEAVIRRQDIEEQLTGATVPPIPAEGWIHLGASLAVGDFNADGFDDLAIGAPGEDVFWDEDIHNAGKVFIYWGTDRISFLPGGVTEKFPQTAEVTEISQAKTEAVSKPDAYDFFGHALAAGDFNCDGYDDLAVGVALENLDGEEDAGMVQIFYGGDYDRHDPAQLEQMAANHFDQYLTSEPLDIAPKPRDQFGFELVAGMFNGREDSGNHCASLAVGAPGSDDNAGAVYVFYGKPSDFLEVDDAERIDQGDESDGVYDKMEAGDRFGEVMGTLEHSSSQDDLWVRSPGDITSGVHGNQCGDYDWAPPPHNSTNRGGRSLHHIFQGSFPDGLDETYSYGNYCGLFAPDMLDTKNRGHIFEAETRVGAVSFYIPTTIGIHRFFDPYLEGKVHTALLLNGRPSGSLDSSRGCYNGTGNRMLRNDYDWANRAEDTEFILVSPTVEPAFFAPNVVCMFDPAKPPEVCDDAELISDPGDPMVFAPIDNDLDGAANCADLECRDHPFCAGEDTSALCTNGSDDDGDGLVDLDDPGCNSFLPPSIESDDILCTNGDDDDRDGLIDCADPDCYLRSTVTRCGNPSQWAQGYGYEGIAGSNGVVPYGFDEYINDIMDDLKLVGLSTAQFRAYGFSAGSRSLSRYMWVHPERVTRVLLSSGGYYLKDDPDLRWPLGLNRNDQFDPDMAYRIIQTWTDRNMEFDPDNGKGWQTSLLIDPLEMAGLGTVTDPSVREFVIDKHWAEKVLTRPVDFMVGRDDASKNKCEAHVVSTTLTDRYASRPGVWTPETCFYTGAAHNARLMSAQSAQRLLNPPGSNDWMAACVPVSYADLVAWDDDDNDNFADEACGGDDCDDNDASVFPGSGCP